MRSAPQATYVIWVLLCSVGILQGLASHYGWTGLSFFRGRRRLGYVCAVALVSLSYVWFFSLTDRNVPGLEGWQLFSRFAIGAVAGLAIVLIISSVLNADMARARLGRLVGLDALRSNTYAGLWAGVLRRRPRSGQAPSHSRTAMGTGQAPSHSRTAMGTGQVKRKEGAQDG